MLGFTRGAVMYAVQLNEKKQGNINYLFYNEVPVVSTQFKGTRFM